MAERRRLRTPDPTPETHARIFFIELEAGRDPAERVGCGDRAVAVPVVVPDGALPIRFALQSLLNARERHPAPGLYNALANMSLRIDSIAIQRTRATIGLSGTFTYGGVCDAPRIAAQLMRTATQFGTVTTADFYVNGNPLRELLSER